MEHGFVVGGIYSRRRDIHERFGGQQQGGISTPTGAPFIFIFTGEGGHAFGYEDHFLPDGVFLYTGEGQIGDMDFVRGNRAIRDHEEDRKSILLFRALGHGKPVRYLGEFQSKGYSIIRSPDQTGELRDAIQFALEPAEHPSKFAPINAEKLCTEFNSYKELVQRKSGMPFTTFKEGMVGEWENYKPHLREIARDRLASEEWRESNIGTGKIARDLIRAIELKRTTRNPGNNLLINWSGRHGDEAKEHYPIIKALNTPEQLKQLERALFDLFSDALPAGTCFEQLREVCGDRYSLLAFIFFLKDSDAFAPILTRTFDTFFARLKHPLITSRQASWPNYLAYNDALQKIFAFLRQQPGLTGCDFIDAHTFVYTREKFEDQSDVVSPRTNVDAVIAMISGSVRSTVRNANGQQRTQRTKNKNLLMSELELEELLENLLCKGDERCALTNIPFQYPNQADADPNFYPSLDRIDSNGDYARDNVQLVCRFANFWKGSGDDSEFRELLAHVRTSDRCVKE